MADAAGAKPAQSSSFLCSGVGFYNNLLMSFSLSCTARAGGHQLVCNFYRCETRLLKTAVTVKAH